MSWIEGLQLGAFIFAAIAILEYVIVHSYYRQGNEPVSRMGAKVYRVLGNFGFKRFKITRVPKNCIAEQCLCCPSSSRTGRAAPSSQDLIGAQKQDASGPEIELNTVAAG